MLGRKAVTFVNGVVVAGDGQVHDAIRIRGGVVSSLGRPAERGDVVVDLHGDIVVPGLVNAHDHLELNSFGRLKWRPVYRNVREWIADFQPRFGSDPQLAAARPETLATRVWAGALKNALCGVTTVCHHNPMHAPLRRRRFPVRVVRRFGLSHSLQIDGDAVSHAYARTPARWPWIVHASEGVDAEARDEIDRLDRLRCLGTNTVLVHGVGIDDLRARRVLGRGSALIWCPSSNEFLFGRTANVRPFAQAGRLALGTDSRLSGEGDLLDELRAAVRTRQLSPEALLRLATSGAAAVLQLPGLGHLATGAPADVAVLRRVAADPYASVVSSSRAEVRLTMVGGMPIVGDTAMQAVFDARWQRCNAVAVDGAPRLLARWIVRAAAALSVREPGLEMDVTW